MNATFLLSVSLLLAAGLPAQSTKASFKTATVIGDFSRVGTKVDLKALKKGIELPARASLKAYQLGAYAHTNVSRFDYASSRLSWSRISIHEFGSAYGRDAKADNASGTTDSADPKTYKPAAHGWSWTWAAKPGTKAYLRIYWSSYVRNQASQIGAGIDHDGDGKPDIKLGANAKAAWTDHTIVAGKKGFDLSITTRGSAVAKGKNSAYYRGFLMAYLYPGKAAPPRFDCKANGFKAGCGPTLAGTARMSNSVYGSRALLTLAGTKAPASSFGVQVLGSQALKNPILLPGSTKCSLGIDILGLSSVRSDKKVSVA